MDRPSDGVISNILSELGWDDGLAIPVANEENKHLIALVEQRQRQVLIDKNELESLEEKVSALSNHLRNVRQELLQTEGLVTARVRETETEEHIMKVAQREEGRLKQETDRINKSVQETIQKKNQLENTIFNKSAQLEELKSQMNWDQQALEAWLEEAEKKGEDSLALQKYTRQDEGKIKELSLQLEKLTQECHQKRRKLDTEVIETQTIQVELDKTAEEFRAAHQDRQNLIQQWENTIEQMQRRDKEIDLLAAKLGRLKSDVRDKEDQIREKQQFLDQQEENNREQEKRIQLADRTAAKLRLDYQDAEQQRLQFADELEALKRTVDRTATDLETTRSQVTQLKKEKQDKLVRLEQAKEYREALQTKLARVTDSKMTAEERAAQADADMAEEAAAQKKLENDLKRLREDQFKRAQELHDSKVDLRNTEANITGSRAALRNLNSKVAKLDHDILKQQEIIYNQDFAIQQLERRINRMHGDTSNEEKTILEAKIKQLNEELDQKNHTHTTLSIQLKHLQDDIRRCKRDMEKICQEKEALTVKIEELNLHNETSQRELKRIRGEKQNLMVEENMMKLEMKRLREMLNGKADQVVSLEKRRLQLETGIKERRQEITIHKDMVQAQIRSADLERQQVSSELQARISKIDKLQKRYEILMVSMAPPEGEEDRSQAYYVIKAAQEKEELQREGDELDAKIRKAEKEIRALENTLVLMNSCNESYRKTFAKVTESSEEVQEKQALEEQLRAVTDKFKYKRRQIRELQEEIQTMTETMENLEKDYKLYTDQKEGLDKVLSQREKESKDHAEKMDRAEKTILRAKRDFRESPNQPMPDEKDVEVREHREFNRRIVAELLRSLSQQHPNVVTSAENFLQQAAIPLPGASGSNASNLGGGSSMASSRTASSRGSARSSVQGTARQPLTPSGGPRVVTVGADLPPATGSGRSSRSGVSSKSSSRK